MKKFYMIIAAGLVSLNMFAGSPASPALPFVQLDYFAKSLAMGSSFIGCASLLPMEDVKIKGGLAYEDYMPELSGTKYMGAEVSIKQNIFGISFSFTKGTGEEITGENYTPYEILLRAGLGVAFSDNFALGVNLKYAKEHLLSSYSNEGLVFDITGTWRLNNTFVTGGLTGLGEGVKSDAGDNYPLPTALDIAGNHIFELAEDHAVQLAARADYYLSGEFALGAGIEYGFADMVFARAGYHYGGESLVPSFASAGLGLKLGNFFVDASYAFASDILNNSFAIGAGVCF